MNMYVHLHGNVSSHLIVLWCTSSYSDPSNKMYPWRFLSELAHDFDHVVIKMDNNQYQAEMELLKILSGDPNLLELVDEMFFEFHIRNPPVKEMVAAALVAAKMER